jgi:aerobic carbon-monoxide dehydrogenase medium subunit
VIPASFEYERAGSVEEAIDLLGRHGEDAKPLAGGQSLLSFLKLRLARPSMLVDIGRLGELAYVREDDDRIAVGALTTYEDAHRDGLLRQECPILAHACGEVGDLQVRHMGTIGGGVVHGDPASDVPAVLVALDGEIVLRGSEGERTVAAGDFCRSPFDVDLRPGELVTEVRVPRTGGAGWSYIKFHPRAQDWAIVGAAAVVRNGGAAVGLANMGPRPLRAVAVEEALASGEAPESAAQAAVEGTEPVDDVFASAEYRRHLAPIVVRRALEEALAR